MRTTFALSNASPPPILRGGKKREILIIKILKMRNPKKKKEKRKKEKSKVKSQNHKIKKKEKKRKRIK